MHPRLAAADSHGMPRRCTGLCEIRNHCPTMMPRANSAERGPTAESGARPSPVPSGGVCSRSCRARARRSPSSAPAPHSRLRSLTHAHRGARPWLQSPCPLSLSPVDQGRWAGCVGETRGPGPCRLLGLDTRRSRYETKLVPCTAWPTCGLLRFCAAGFRMPRATREHKVFTLGSFR